MEKVYFNAFSDYCKKKFGRKLYKVPLDAGMTCPNRDGKIDSRGCIFCDGDGSGDFAIRYHGQKLTENDLVYNHQHAGAGNYIGYFQSFTNTYAPIEKLRTLYHAALEDPLFAGISIATRPDCLDEDVLSLLKECQTSYPDKFIWIELGLQTIHENTAIWMRRGYPLRVFDTAVKQLQNLNIDVIVHIIIGFPQETDEMIYQTIEHLNQLHISGIKLQLLHYLKDTDLGNLYLKNQYQVLTKEQYINLIVNCIGRLHPDIVIHRLSGDGNRDILLAPLWSNDKRSVLNGIRHTLKVRNITQGILHASDNETAYNTTQEEYNNVR